MKHFCCVTLCFRATAEQCTSSGLMWSPPLWSEVGTAPWHMKRFSREKHLRWFDLIPCFSRKPGGLNLAMSSSTVKKKKPLLLLLIGFLMFQVLGCVMQKENISWTLNIYAMKRSFFGLMSKSIDKFSHLDLELVSAHHISVLLYISISYIILYPVPLNNWLMSTRSPETSILNAPELKMHHAVSPTAFMTCVQ